MNVTAEDHARALWHTMWFHALESTRSDQPDFMTPEDGAKFDMDAEEVREYNEWQAERDIPVERKRQAATFAACRAAMQLWGYHVPDADELVGFCTFDSWCQVEAGT